jgi:aminoglycoside/choline kinase family phosphotransferase
VGTVFERSKVPLHKWVYATHLMCASKKGISSKQLERLLGVTYKTAWFMAHRIREAMNIEPTGKLGEDGGPVEVDETYWGNVGKQRPGARGGDHKMKIVSLVDRESGEKRSFHVPNVTAKTLKPIMQKHISAQAALLTEWYCPAQGLDVDVAGYSAAWEEALAPMLARQSPGVTVLRDYHAENIMLLGGQPGAPQGLIDFQDALVGHPAYDLVSLLQDARRDVSEDLETAMLLHYAHHAGVADEEFLADYARLGAQRNTKIVGIFTRLDRRDGKPRYLEMIPRVWDALERDLAHPALAPVARWFDANIPDTLRFTHGAFTA